MDITNMAKLSALIREKPLIKFNCEQKPFVDFLQEMGKKRTDMNLMIGKN